MSKEIIDKFNSGVEIINVSKNDTDEIFEIIENEYLSGLLTVKSLKVKSYSKLNVKIGEIYDGEIKVNGIKKMLKFIVVSIGRIVEAPRKVGNEHVVVYTYEFKNE